MSDDEALAIIRSHTSGMVELDTTRRFAFVAEAKLEVEGVDLGHAAGLIIAAGGQRAVLESEPDTQLEAGKYAARYEPPTKGFWVPVGI